MVETIVPNSRADGYQSAYESLCAKLQQAYTLSEVLANGDMTDSQMHRLIWCLADLLEVACNQCETLTASDFESVE